MPRPDFHFRVSGLRAGSGIQVARSDDAPRISGSERTRPQGNAADASAGAPGPRSYGGTTAAAAVNVGQPSRAFGARVYFGKITDAAARRARNVWPGTARTPQSSP